jgi:hypothetical protein
MELILLAVFGLLAAGLLVGACILGTAALGDLRRSGDQLRGRGFAVCAALCGPLLLLNSLVLFVLLLVAKSMAFHGLPGIQLAVLPLSVLLLLVLNAYLASLAWRWAADPGRRAGFGALAAVILCGIMALAVPSLVIGITIWLPALMKARAERPGVTAAVSGGSKRGYEVDFTLPPNQVAVFEVVKRKNRVLEPLPKLGMYSINSSEEPCAGTFIWAENPEDRGLDGMPKWRFGILSTNGNTIAEGLGVPKPPAGFSSSTDAWVALQPDKEQVLGLPPGNESAPGYGLRIRTATVASQPGVKRRATGFGTNWPEMLPEQPTSQ